MKEGLLLLNQMREARQRDTGMMEMPLFFPATITREEARNLPWQVFRERLNPIASIKLPGTHTECIFTPKNVAWCSKNINTFIGSQERQIFELDDLTDSEGKSWFDINFKVAKQLLTHDREETQVNIGFNPQEFSVGHHSVPRLHSHIRVIGQPLDEIRRKHMLLNEFDWFDRLAFIEPFAQIHHDYIRAFVDKGGFSQRISNLALKLGYTSVLFKADGHPEDMFIDLKKLYSGMKSSYNQIEEAFTERITDERSGRYIPRGRNERMLRIEKYIQQNQQWLSDPSQELLHYLASYIKDGEARGDNPRNISRAEMIYITRGLAGACTFTFKHDKTMRWDFLPRVITTSGVTKTISGEQKATIIAKEKTPATQPDIEAIDSYHREIQAIVESMKTNVVSEELQCGL